ncbi:hypothetical protein Taro_033409 [Colocasia esculenta]|uniref:Uncharacterized protein n=1 Tax=Colocasia esculenta TaxID=4460 RepID=A0A843VNQ8_COLES|nr:hypothetical protein [Colocasia esculenta]
MKDVIRISNRLNGKAATRWTVITRMVDDGNGWTVITRMVDDGNGWTVIFNFRMLKIPSRRPPQVAKPRLPPRPLLLSRSTRYALSCPHALLELQDTGARLRRERETLTNTLNYCVRSDTTKLLINLQNSIKVTSNQSWPLDMGI